MNARNIVVKTLLNADKRLTTAAQEWRRTEKEVIADKANTEKQQAHQKAKMRLRDATEMFIRASTPP